VGITAVGLEPARRQPGLHLRQTRLCPLAKGLNGPDIASMVITAAADLLPVALAGAYKLLGRGPGEERPPPRCS
jgi:hypothetical protein